MIACDACNFIEHWRRSVASVPSKHPAQSGVIRITTLPPPRNWGRQDPHIETRNGLGGKRVEGNFKAAWDAFGFSRDPQIKHSRYIMNRAARRLQGFHDSLGRMDQFIARFQPWEFKIWWRRRFLQHSVSVSLEAEMKGTGK